MKVCIPIAQDLGVDSKVFGHFGSAPSFYLADMESGTAKVIANGNQHHSHGMCQPLVALQGENVDAVVVGGIGRGALMKLKAMQVSVYLAGEGTVAETLAALADGSLPVVAESQVCGGHHGHGHGHGHGCSH
jgi:predicted Fe-Mo cluster-binding NifX family protein